MNEEYSVWKFSVLRGGTEEAVNRAVAAMTGALCSHEDHEGPCEVPWSIVGSRFDDLDDDQRRFYEQEFDLQSLGECAAGDQMPDPPQAQGKADQMKPLHDGFEPSRVDGRELETVRFASNLATLQLSGGPLLTVLGAVTVSIGDRASPGQEAPPWDKTHLPSLIGQRIDSAATDEAGRLIVRFRDGSTLEFAPDDSGYESFIVSIDGREWFA